MKTIFFLYLVMILMLTGCTPQPTIGGFYTSINGDWKSTGSSATVKFDEGKISGFDGCNRFAGRYVSEGNTIKISDQMMSTMMACPSPVMENSIAFKDGLLNASYYQNDTKSLILLNHDGKKLLELDLLSSTFEPAKYQIKHYHNGKKEVVGLIENSGVTAEFTADGKLSGNSGCNQFTTSYSLKGNQITIGVLAMTRQLCAPALMEQEQLIASALYKAATIKRQGEKWEIRDENNTLLLDML